MTGIEGPKITLFFKILVDGYFFDYARFREITIEEENATSDVLAGLPDSSYESHNAAMKSLGWKDPVVQEERTAPGIISATYYKRQE